MASNTDVVKKNYTITCLYYVSIYAYSRPQNWGFGGIWLP